MNRLTITFAFLAALAGCSRNDAPPSAPAVPAASADSASAPAVAVALIAGAAVSEDQASAARSPVTSAPARPVRPRVTTRPSVTTRTAGTRPALGRAGVTTRVAGTRAAAIPGEAPVSLFKVQTILTRYGSDGVVARDLPGFQLATYEALFAARMPEGITSVRRDDIRIDSLIADTGANLTGVPDISLGWPVEPNTPTNFVAPSPQVIAVDDDGWVPFTVRTRGGVPDDSPGMWLTGALCPFIDGDKTTTTEKQDFPLEIGSLIKAGDISLSLRNIGGDPARYAQITFTAAGPLDSITKLELFDGTGEPCKSSFTLFGDPLVQGGRTMMLSVNYQKLPLTAQVTYASNRHRANIPFRVPLATLRVAYLNDADQPYDPAKTLPPVQVIGASLVTHETHFGQIFSDVRKWPAGKPPSGINLLMDARDDSVHVARLADVCLQVDQWSEDGTVRAHKASDTVLPVNRPRGFAELPLDYPRHEVCVQASMPQVPAAGVGLLTLKGTAAFLVPAGKSVELSAEGLDFRTRRPFKLGNGTGIFLGRVVSPPLGPPVPPGPGGITITHIPAADPAAALPATRSTVPELFCSFDLPDDLAPRIIGATYELDGKSTALKLRPPRFPEPGKTIRNPVQLAFPALPTAGKLTFTAAESLESRKLTFHFIVGVGPRVP